MLRFAYTLASQDESLELHLLDVARQCNRALLKKSQAARRVAVCAALAHDVGKATTACQRAVRQGTQPDIGSAASCGALWCWWLSRTLARWERLAAVAAVLDHHGVLAHTPQDELRALASEASDGRMLHDQVSSMDVEGAGRFLQESGGRLLLRVPTTAPSRQRVLDALAEDRQVESGGPMDQVRVEAFLEQHSGLLAAAHH